MPHLIQPGAGEHSTHRSAASLSDQTNNQPDEGLERGSGKTRPEHGKETGQRARCGGAGRHRRITLTRTVNEQSMLSSSHPKIHEPRVTGVSPRTSDSARKLRNTRSRRRPQNKSEARYPWVRRGYAAEHGPEGKECTMVDQARARRLAKRISHIVAAALEHEVKDPRLSMVTITDTRVTGDLRDATVYYTVLGRSVDDVPDTAGAA